MYLFTVYFHGENCHLVLILFWFGQRVLNFSYEIYVSIGKIEKEMSEIGINVRIDPYKTENRCSQ